jgi:biotin operon repressor
MRKNVDAKAIAAEYLDGSSVREIADRLGVSNTVIEGRLKEEGVKMRSRKEAIRLLVSRRRALTPKRPRYLPEQMRLFP